MPNYQRLEKLIPRWAINGRGKRISLPRYAIWCNGDRLGEVESFLRQSGRIGWTASAPSLQTMYKHLTRADAVDEVLATALERKKDGDD